MDYKLLQTNDGSYTLEHPIYKECYHSLEGARYEAQNLYIKQSQFENFVLNNKKAYVLDVGLGLGYNAIETIKTWLNSNNYCDLKLISLEHDRYLFSHFLSADAAWMIGWDEFSKKLCSSLLQVYNEKYNIYKTILKHPKNSNILEWIVIVEDALNIDFSDYLRNQINFIWHDPFSYKKNPSLWEEQWFKRIKQYCDNNVILLTYSVAKVVREALQKAGWQYQIINTTGLKRHWLKAWI